MQEHFQEQLELPISEGSIFTYNQQAYELLEQFEQKLIAQLLHTRVIHADETGININGKNRWLHCVSSPRWTLYYAQSDPDRLYAKIGQLNIELDWLEKRPDSACRRAAEVDRTGWNAWPCQRNASFSR